jgi:hypothetical protein
MKLLRLFSLSIITISMVFSASLQAHHLTPQEARSLAKEAYIWGYTMVDDIRVFNNYFVDENNPEYKGGVNVIGHNTRLFTPADTTIQTINSDTLYSFVGIDVRDEPIVVSFPQVQEGRYYGFSIFDMWGHCAMLGTITTGNDVANFMIVGPSWEGQAPEGIKKVVQVETTIATSAIRIQLFNPDDLDNVLKVQAGISVQTLSSFLGEQAPTKSSLNTPAVLTKAEQKSSLEFFRVLNEMLVFAPTHPSEVELRKRLTKIGIGDGLTFDVASLSPEIKTALELGVADAWEDLDEAQRKLNTGELTAGDAFGTREYLQNNYLHRAVGVVLGGNAQPKEEVIYPFIGLDESGKPLNGSNDYTITFPGDQLPPAGQFWSITMYDGLTQLLVSNPIDRYLLNTPMEPNWVKDADGGYTFYIQNGSPDEDKKANWLPAPDGPFYMVMRLYEPSLAAQEGEWQAPKPRLVE